MIYNPTRARVCLSTGAAGSDSLSGRPTAISLAEFLRLAQRQSGHRVTGAVGGWGSSLRGEVSDQDYRLSLDHIFSDVCKSLF